MSDDLSFIELAGYILRNLSAPLVVQNSDEHYCPFCQRHDYDFMQVHQNPLMDLSHEEDCLFMEFVAAYKREYLKLQTNRTLDDNKK